MKKCKLCPYRRTCKDECYGENPCSFAKAFDALGKKLELKMVCIESLRSQRDEALAKVPEHRIIGEYVLTPIQNAFNGKTSWWLTKKGCVMALYCFTGTDPKEVERQVENLGPYTRLLNERLNSTKVNECVYDIALVAQHMIEEHSIEVENSRELFDNVLEWAREFEAGFTEEEDAAGDYMEHIEEFAEEMLRSTYPVKQG